MHPGTGEIISQEEVSPVVEADFLVEAVDFQAVETEAVSQVAEAAEDADRGDR